MAIPMVLPFTLWKTLRKAARSLFFGGFATLVVIFCDSSGDPLLCEGRRPAHLGAGQMAFQTSKNLRTADEWWLRWVAWSKENVTFLSENDKSFLIDRPASFVLLSICAQRKGIGGKFFLMRTCGSSWHVDVDLVALLIKLYRVLLDRPWCHW